MLRPYVNIFVAVSPCPLEAVGVPFANIIFNPWFVHGSFHVCSGLREAIRKPMPKTYG